MTEDAAVERLQKEFENRAGWDVVNAEIDAWWVPEPDKKLQGQLLGHKVIKQKRGGKRVVFLVRTAFDVMAIPVGAGKGAKSERIKAGSIIGVGESAQLTGLRPYVANKCLVQMKCLGKVDIGDGQTMWKYAVAGKGTKAPFIFETATAPPDAPPDETESNTGDDDIPF